MSRTTKMLTVITVILLLAVLAMTGMIWITKHHVIMNFRLYPKDAQALDLRGEALSTQDYEKLQRKLPDCQILWNVEFQGGLYSSDSTELTVSTLSEADIQQLDYFPWLRSVDALECDDYEEIFLLLETYPSLKVTYQVPIGDRLYPQDTRELTLSSVTDAEFALLPRLPQLQTVTLTDASDMASAQELHSYCREKGIDFCFTLGAETYSPDVEELTLTEATEEQLQLLDMLPNLKKLHLIEPAASAESLLSLRETYSDLTVTWEKTVCGLKCTDADVDIDLSEMNITSIEEVEQGMAYLPKAKSLFLGFCGLDNEEIAAFRERSRENFKVVWVVDLSGKMQVRTDIDNFMPSRDGWGYVRDHEVDNIRYCEDLICIDLGHMGIKDVSFLEPLVNLEYLILAHTEVQYLNGIENCKKLKYLEVDWSPIKDLSPLVHCTALEDFNMGKTWPDITPILEMTWLKNLYMIQGRAGDAWKATQALPNTRVVASGDYTVSSGWRQLPNYYAMRDILGMHYM